MNVILVLFCMLAMGMAYDVQEAMLKLHNKDRAQHKVDKLKTNPELEKFAQTCAEYYAKMNKVDFSCPEGLPYGQTVGTLAGVAAAPYVESALPQIYHAWIIGSKKYDYKTGGSIDGSDVGAFKQIVWKDTEELGCGAAQNESEKNTIIVCLYDPRGNFVGEEKENIFE